jgi:hypothetical protein
MDRELRNKSNTSGSDSDRPSSYDRAPKRPAKSSRKSGLTPRQLQAWIKKLERNALPDSVLDIVEQQIKSRRRGRVGR